MGAHETRLIDPGPLSVEGLENLFAQLPAETRAHVRWSPTDLKRAINAFLCSARTDLDLRELASALVAGFRLISPAIVALAPHADAIRAGLEQSWRQDLQVLREHANATTADMADWVAGVWTAFIVRALSLVADPAADFMQMLRSSDEALVADAGVSVRTQALMMAAIECARTGGAQDEIAQLVERAFDEVSNLLVLLGRANIDIAPFAAESPEERGRRLQRYLADLREVVSDAELDDLDASRMHSLR